MFGVDYGGVGMIAQTRVNFAVDFQLVEIFEEEYPTGLFGIIQLGSAASLFAENVIDILEGLFKHEQGLAATLLSGK